MSATIHKLPSRNPRGEIVISRREDDAWDIRHIVRRRRFNKLIGFRVCLEGACAFARRKAETLGADFFEGVQ